MSIYRIRSDNEITTFAGMVYVIYDSQNERFRYVGKTTTEIKERLQKHLSDPKSKIGFYIKSNIATTKSWLVLRILLSTEDEIIAKERSFIIRFDPTFNSIGRNRIENMPLEKVSKTRFDGMVDYYTSELSTLKELLPRRSNKYLVIRQ